MRKAIFLALLLSLFIAPLALATDYTATDFTVKDPVILPGGGFASSSHYGLESAIGQIALGTSSATTFKLNSGFLAFLGLPADPSNLVATPVSTSEIDLSWSDNAFNESSYIVERRPGSGGAYAQIASLAANATSYSDTGLSAATTYFYRVKAVNADGSSNYSNEAGATTNSNPPPGGNGGNGGSGGSGGGPGGYFPPPSSSGSAMITLIGKAYPKSAITILVDGAIKATPIADSFASFSSSIDVPSGVHSFSLYSTDAKGVRSLTYTFTLTVTAGTPSSVSGVFLAPTIQLDKSEVRKGDTLTILGQTAPSSTVTVHINSDVELTRDIPAGSDGTYLLAFNTMPLEYGDHSTKSQATFIDNSQSEFSQTATFKISDRNVQKYLAGDTNKNGKVNIVDFSILLYWWGKTSQQAIDVADINHDGKVNLVDLSIMLYNWTG